jgi:hypothetical protein
MTLKQLRARVKRLETIREVTPDGIIHTVSILMAY